MTQALNPSVTPLKQSGIRAASARCQELGGINLGQGVCDIPTPQTIQDAATRAMADNHNMYSACEGILPLREKLAEKITNFNGVPVDPKTEVLVTHGSTGAFVSACQTLLQPGDEVVLFEPFYGYHKSILSLLGVGTRATQINLQDFSIDLDELAACITDKTKAILICTPNNPTGKVFSHEELMAIGELAAQYDLWIITDEIYEYITYPGFKHTSMASLAKFKDRTITLSGFSKTFNMTGWRLGYVFGPEEVIGRMALVQDLLYICPSTPLQHALLAAFDMPESYFDEMRAGFLTKRDRVLSVLRDCGFQAGTPQGAYYIMADFSKLGYADDAEAANVLMEEAKIATVTGRSFYMDPAHGKHSLRFCYALTEEKVNRALDVLIKMYQKTTA